MPKSSNSVSDASVQQQALAPSQQAEPKSIVKNIQLVAGVLLIGLIGVGFYLHKKKNRGRPDIKSLNTLGRLQLGANQHIYLIECGNEVMLIGATSTQITLLQQLPLPSLLTHTATHSEKISYTFTAPVFSKDQSTDFASLLNTYSSNDPD